LAYEILADPQHGTLSGSLPSLTYTPEANFYGSDSFSFVVNDGVVSSEPAEVLIEIIPVNDAPVAESQSAVTMVGQAVEITLVGSDIDGDPINFNLVNSPEHGTLTGAAPNLLYTPETGYSGADAFSFTVDDGVAVSNTAEVTITVNPAGPVTVFFDDFESDQGWIFNPSGSDSASAGLWARTDPNVVNLSGYKQLEAYSGSNDLVTGPAGLRTFWWWTWSVDDVNSGVTSVRSPQIALPIAGELTLSLQYYFAHDSSASAEDYFRILVVGSSTHLLFEELGANNNDDAAWEMLSLDLSDFAGQSVYLLIETADNGSNNLVEAAVDDILLVAE
jgi:hypothetical protein